MATEIKPPRDHAEKVERLRLVLAVIESHPKHWDQGEWHCGTAHCFAGHAQLLALGLNPDTNIADDEYEEYESTVRCDAMEWLGLTEFEAQRMFHPEMKLLHFRTVIDGIAANPPHPAAVGG